MYFLFPTCPVSSSVTFSFIKISRILNLTTLFVTPQYHILYIYQFTYILNAASYGLFSDNPFSASGWDKLVRSYLECHLNQYYFYPSNQYHRMSELHVDRITPDEGHLPLRLVMA